jgi:glycerol-3-phosphate dehydrogenase
VPRLYGHDGCYIFQNADGRIFFVIPYEQDFTLVGTTDRDYTGDPAAVHASPEEIAYLCTAASEYLKTPITPEMVVWTYSGVRPLHDEGGGAAQAATRDYVLTLDAPDGAPPLLSIFGGKITTFRRLAEAALKQLAPHLPKETKREAGWTARETLPGGDFPMQGFEAEVQRVLSRHPFLGAARARRLVRAYGTRVAELVGDARSEQELGRDFGAGLTEAELCYLARFEWARTAEDVVWRRSKLGLRLTQEQIAAVDDALRRIVAEKVAA